jgi:hypothetical protein
VSPEIVALWRDEWVVVAAVFSEVDVIGAKSAPNVAFEMNL